MPPLIHTRHRALLMLLAIATGSWLSIAQGPLRWLENWVSDLRIVMASPRENAPRDIVVLTVNEDTLKQFPYRSPVSRAYLANLVKTLETKGARAVGLDFLFDQSTEPTADKALYDALQGASIPVFVGYTDSSNLTPDQSNFLHAFTAGLRTAYVDIPMDNADGIVRQAIAGRTAAEGRFVPGLALALARVGKGENVTFDSPVSIRYRGIPEGTDGFDPMSTVVNYPSHTLAALPDEWIRDKFVLIGADFPQSSEDRWRTPYASFLGFRDGQLPGVMLHALTLAQFLEDRHFTVPPAWLDLAVYLCLCMLVMMVTREDRSHRSAALMLLLGLLGFWAVSFTLFRLWGIQVATMGPTLAGIIGTWWRLHQQVTLFRKRHEESQALALKNQQLALDMARNYGKTLEHEVKQRTAELVATQQKLIAHEKAAALGVFTAGMAHEINNPANFIAAGAQNAEAETAKLKRFVDDLLSEDADPEISTTFGHHFRKIMDAHELVRNGINRIVTIVRNLRATHPEGEVGMQTARLEDAIMTAWTVVSPTVAIKTDLHTDFVFSPAVSCKIADITQVFIAALLNALHAIEDAIREESDRTGIISISMQHDNDHVRVLITDNGIGIPDANLTKVFDPFFTTKIVGRGTGLGLSMSRDIIQAHGGEISIRSLPGQSTTLEIALPLHERLD